MCVTVTLLDGLVLARSWFAHSMNYRSGGGVRPRPRGSGFWSRRRGRSARSSSTWLPAVRETRGRRRRRRWRRLSSSRCRSRRRRQRCAAVYREISESDYELPVWAGEIPLQLQPLAPVTRSAGGRRRPGPRLCPPLCPPRSGGSGAGDVGALRPSTCRRATPAAGGEVSGTGFNPVPRFRRPAVSCGPSCCPSFLLPYVPPGLRSSRPCFPALQKLSGCSDTLSGPRTRLLHAWPQTL